MMTGPSNPYEPPAIPPSPGRHWTRAAIGVLLTVSCVLAALVALGAAVLHAALMISRKGEVPSEVWVADSALGLASVAFFNAGWACLRGRWRRASASAVLGIGLANVWLAILIVLQR